MENRNTESDAAVIQSLAIEKANMEIQLIRLQHENAQLLAKLEEIDA